MSQLSEFAFCGYVWDLNSIISALAATGTLAAAFYAARSASQNRKASEAKIMLHFLNRYGSQEMNEKLKLLRKWKENHPETTKYWNDRKRNNIEDSTLWFFINNAVTRITTEGIDSKSLDEARRFVYRYFTDAFELYEGELISKRTYKQIIETWGLELFFEVVELLNFAMTDKYDETQFNKIRLSLNE
jgi:hypothetical protein